MNTLEQMVKEVQQLLFCYFLSKSFENKIKDSKKKLVKDFQN